MLYPLISIIIATRNSQENLPRVLESIKKQTYPKDKLEVLIVDGGSTDKTRSIAKEFGYKVVDNPKIGFVSGKHLGYLIAKGAYLMYLDSDEEIENPDSLKIKISAFQSDKKIKAVTTSGYKNPSNYPAISHYLNEFGDPFSYFIYQTSMNYNFFLDSLHKKCTKYFEEKNYDVFDFSVAKSLPLLEFVEMGGMIDLNYFRKQFPQIKKDPTLIAHFLSLLVDKKALIAIVRNDPIIHYSVVSFDKYLSKISWRVRNNIYNKDKLALSGFEGREQFQPALYRIKRYLFIPYSVSIIFPTLDGLYLSFTKHDPIFLIHPILCLYTTFLIMYYYLLNLINLKYIDKIYGE